VHTGFWCGNLMERSHLEDTDVDGRINIKIYLREVGWRHGLNRSGSVSQDKDRWPAFVNAVTSIYIPYNALNFVSS
jgi:hypothetical protein